jgi:hypothetical protein
MSSLIYRFCGPLDEASGSTRATRCVPFLANASPATRQPSSSVRSIRAAAVPRVSSRKVPARRAFTAAMDLPPPPPTLPPPPQVLPCLARFRLTHRAVASTTSALAGSGGAVGVRGRRASHARSEPQPCPDANWQPRPGSWFASSAPAARSKADERLRSRFVEPH